MIVTLLFPEADSFLLVENNVPVYLSATHIPSGHTLRFHLEEKTYPLGRVSSKDGDDKLALDFDPTLSRRAMILHCSSKGLRVERDGSRHPLFFEGQEREVFELVPGQRWTCAETVFEFHDEAPQTLSFQRIEEIQRDNASHILQVLLRFQTLFGRALPLTELAQETAQLLKDILPESDFGLFRVEADSAPEAIVSTRLQPSHSLVMEALRQKQAVYHLWNAGSETSEYTHTLGESWVLACPLSYTAQNIVLYSSGRDSGPDPGELERAVLALVAQMLGQYLEGQQAVHLTAALEAEEKVNAKLRVLLQTLENSLALEQEKGYQRVFLEGGKTLTEAELVHFELDLSEVIKREEGPRRGRDEEGHFLAVAFERRWPEGLVCRRRDKPFETEDEGWVAALAGFVETVLENRRLHGQLAHSLQELERSQAQALRSNQWAAAGRLAANVAHELNTPLGAIKLSAETARGFLDKRPQAARESLELLLRAVERCQQVSSRFLVYSKPREKKTLETFPLSRVVQDSLDFLSATIESKKIQVDNRVPPEFTVHGDQQDCYWATTNVLKNALESFPGDQKNARVELWVEDGSEALELCIQDNGPGVPKEIREKIFEPFFSTRKIGEGNGLGLATTRRDLATWGGRLELRSSSSDGACFALLFPKA